MVRVSILYILIFLLSACGGSTIDRKDATQYDKGSFNQLAKLDQDRMADYEIRENIESLKILMLKLYKSCLLYTSPSPRDPIGSRMPSSA